MTNEVQTPRACQNVALVSRVTGAVGLSNIYWPLEFLRSQYQDEEKYKTAHVTER